MWYIIHLRFKSYKKADFRRTSILLLSQDFRDHQKLCPTGALILIFREIIAHRIEDFAGYHHFYTVETYMVTY